MNKLFLSSIILSSTLLTACGGEQVAIEVESPNTSIDINKSQNTDTDVNDSASQNNETNDNDSESGSYSGSNLVEDESNTENEAENDDSVIITIPAVAVVEGNDYGFVQNSSSNNTASMDTSTIIPETIASPELETETITNLKPETETITNLKPETETITNLKPETETITSLEPETETITSLEPETDIDVDEINDTDTSVEYSASTYTAGTTYIAGDIINNNGKIYRCLVAGWCSTSAAAYEPGVGFASDSAWVLVDESIEELVEEVSSEESTEDSTENNSDDNAENSSEDKEVTDINIRNCLPEGLYITPGTNPNLCAVYDEDGREIMDDDHPRRIIGYFTSWRTGYNDQPAYLVNDIPWDKITHINYAFAHIDGNYKVSVGDTSDSSNPATGLTWDTVSGAEMDTEFSFNGHFNLLAKYKKQYPDVKTLISVGGWAETGGHFDEEGRDADGGFYTLTIKDNGDINYDAINTFADSAVEFLRSYHFDGVDIDYEYPTSMAGSGNPDDVEFSEPRRAQLWAGYMELMKTLREKLDIAGEEDKHHYMLTIASPSSGYLLRGMEAFQAVKYLDYVNIMSYDLHGAWNEFVGPNAALFDDGKDVELAKWDVYSTTQYDGIGYLNTDWSYHYFRGAMAAGRINIGIPYYTRGWQNVTGGTNGLWGTAPATSAITCPAGTGNNCGYGAQGIDNLWHDLDTDGNELFAGSNPMWHAMNLKAGISGSYLTDYGLDVETQNDAKMLGQYGYHYDDTLVASWLWNEEKKVFLSIEDETSFSKKLDWVIANGIGGVMFWELAGDYDYDNAKDEYFMGQTLTSLAYSKLAAADNYEVKAKDSELSQEAIDLAVDISDFANGDSNYPITPTITLTNNSDINLPGGTLIEFDLGTSTSADIVDQSGMGLILVDDGSNSAGNNVGGLDYDHHRVQLQIPNWQTLAPNDTINFTIRYYLPAAIPSNWTVEIDGKRYVIRQEKPNLPILKSL